MTDSEHLYFDYLCDLISGDRMSKVMTKEHSILLNRLNSIEFLGRFGNDRNRVLDGLDLRERFCLDNDICPWKEMNARPCSFLEMMVSLSLRCEHDIMEAPREKDKSSYWFWEFSRNADLDLMDDVSIRNGRFSEDDIDYICNNIMFRRYDANGDGGLFPLAHPREDMRNVELWYQMMAWLEENYYGDDIFL